MATINSNEIIAASIPPTRLLKQNELGGRVQTMKFSLDVNTSTNPFNSGDFMKIGTLPKNARVTGGNFAFAAAGTSATGSIGDLATTTQILTATSVASAGNAALSRGAQTLTSGTITAGYGYEVLTPTDIYLKAGGANWANGHYEGTIDYVTDAS